MKSKKHLIQYVKFTNSQNSELSRPLTVHEWWGVFDKYDNGDGVVHLTCDTLKEFEFAIRNEERIGQ